MGLYQAQSARAMSPAVAFRATAVIADGEAAEVNVGADYSVSLRDIDLLVGSMLDLRRCRRGCRQLSSMDRGVLLHVSAIGQGWVLSREATSASKPAGAIVRSGMVAVRRPEREMSPRCRDYRIDLNQGGQGVSGLMVLLSSNIDQASKPWRSERKSPQQDANENQLRPFGSRRARRQLRRRKPVRR